jgi:hypothetical protein
VCADREAYQSFLDVRAAWRPIVRERILVSKIAYQLAALSLATAFSCATSPTNAQLLARKDLSLAAALTMATTTIQTCKSQGYNVSAHVVGRNGEVLVAIRGDSRLLKSPLGAPPSWIVDRFRYTERRDQTF